MARVLVVEDDLNVRRAVVLRLSREGHTILERADGRSALETLRQEPVDVVVLDLMLPGLDGFELIDHLQADLRTVGVQVIVLSGREGPDGIVRALEAGAADYLTKPFHARELVARVNLAVRRARADAESALVTSLLVRLETVPEAERAARLRAWLAQEAEGGEPDTPARRLLSLVLAASEQPGRAPAAC